MDTRSTRRDSGAEKPPDTGAKIEAAYLTD